MTWLREQLGRFGLGGATIIICAAAIVLLGVWSTRAELEQVSRAPGQVIPTGRVQVIQSTDGGTISDIRVREGDHVKKGQVLVTLDQVKIRASVDEGAGKVASLMSSMTRINAELFDRPLDFPQEVKAFPDFVANQSLLYHKRRQALDDQIGSLQAQLRLMQQELDMNMPLLKSGDVSRADVIRLQRGVTDLQSQMVNVRNKYIQDLQAEYTRTEEELVSAREILAQRKDALNDTEIRAPSDGIVKNVKLTTIGGVLRPGDEVLSVVPTGEVLIVEAKVSPSDISYVRKGQGASIKFDAYDSSIYGSGSGKVIYISPDTLVEQSSKGELVFYRVHVSVDTAKMKPHRAGEAIEIQPGMTATVEIQTGSNTVFKYLMKPILKAMSESMTER